MWSGNSLFSIHGVSYGVSHSREGISTVCVTRPKTVSFVRLPADLRKQGTLESRSRREAVNTDHPAAHHRGHSEHKDSLTCGFTPPARMCTRGQRKFPQNCQVCQFPPTVLSELGYRVLRWRLRRLGGVHLVMDVGPDDAEDGTVSYAPEPLFSPVPQTEELVVRFVRYRLVEPLSPFPTNIRNRVIMVLLMTLLASRAVGLKLSPLPAGAFCEELH